MDFLATVAFNLRGAESEDYEDIKSSLRDIGLSSTVKDAQGK